MRRLPALVATLALAAATLAGCAVPSAASECPRPTSSPGSPLDAVTVTGELGTAPAVQVLTPFVADDVAYDDTITGTGTRLRHLTQLVQLDISLYSGDTGEQVVSGAYDESGVPIVTLARWTSIIPKLASALKCVSAGSRVAVALPPGGIADDAAASIGLDPDQSLVAVVDVDRVYLAAADGADVFNDARGLPTVVRAPDGRPGVIIPDTDPPQGLVVQTLLRGSGPAVQDGDAVRVNYTGLTWADKTVFDTTWDGEAASVTLDAVVPGFASALRGATVGSQVMVVVPPDQGYGDQDQGSIPAGSTLVFVIDILGIDPPAATG